MIRYVLDARTATPHFPGIGRYVTSLATALAPLLTPDERLTVLHHPDHLPALTPFPAVTLAPAAVSPFALAQQWQIPRLLRGLVNREQGLGIRDQESGVRGQGSGGSDLSSIVHRPSSIVGRPSSVLYHSCYNLMPYAPGAPTILTAYDLIPLLMPGQSSGRARLLARWANVLALRAARLVLAISEATRRDYLAHFRVPAERIVTTPLAADPVFRPQSDAAVAALRARYALPERYVLYLGSNKPHKNLTGLVEAWEIANQQSSKAASSKSANQQISKSANQQIANSKSADHVSRITYHASRLVIAGAWDERYPEAKQRAQQLGLSDDVMFLGPMAGVDLPVLYAGAELFVFPSRYEGFGLPVLEAMACGAPVICSNVSSLPEVAGAAALQVDPLDTAALAEAIVRVLGDPALRQQMRVEGLVQAGRFSWTRTAQQTLDAYRQVISETS